MKTTLIIMAAGIGSRFGTGIKQLAKMSEGGEIIMDYSIYDAIEAGFDEVVFIIRRDFEDIFKEKVGSRFAFDITGKVIPIDCRYRMRSVDAWGNESELSDIITLPEGSGLDVTARDIVENPHNVEILEIAAEQVPRSLEDVDFAVANGNYALEAGITDKLLTTEDKDSEGAKTYANVVAVRAGDEERPEIKALVEALKSDTIRAFIEEKYGANVIPMF